MKNILVIFGGTSSEHEVSLQSAYSIIQAIDRRKYTPILVGISKTGQWKYFHGSIKKIINNNWNDRSVCVETVLDVSKRELIIFTTNIQRKKIDGIFPVLHGKGGEDGTIQGMANLANIPCMGCGVISSAIGMNKMMAHTIAESIGVQVPKCIWANKIEKDFRYPVFVKPLDGGSSLGISKVNSQEDLSMAINKAREYGNRVIIEEFIDGIEVGVAILKKGNQIICGEIDEVLLENGFFDFEEKYTLKTSKIIIPAQIKEKTKKQIINAAKKIFDKMECKGFARIDFFVDKNDEIYFNEINTIPGFTIHSRFPNMLRAKGYSFDEIVNTIIDEEFQNE